MIIDPEGEYGPTVDAAGGNEVDVARPGEIRLPLLTAILRTGVPAMRAARAASLLAPVVGAASDLARERLARAIQRLLADARPDLAALPDALSGTDPRLADSVAQALAGPLALLVGSDGPPPTLRALSLSLAQVDTTLLPALLPAVTEAAVGHLQTACGQGSGWLWLTLDEFHLYLEREAGARVLVELAKRARKRGIVLTAVTQHLVDLLRHPDGEAILAACETVALFRPGIDVAPFAEALRLDAPAQARAVALAPGQALLQAAGRLRLVRVELSTEETAIADTRPDPARTASRSQGQGGAPDAPVR